VLNNDKIKKQPSHFSLSGLSLRLQILTIFILLPIYGLVVYANIEQRQATVKHVGNEGKLLLESINQELNGIVEGVDLLLRTLSESNIILNSPNECNQFLGTVLKRYQRFSNFGVIDPEGNLVCSALKTEEKINYSSFSFFKDVLATNEFSVGHFQVSPINQKGTLYLGQPILDKKSGKLRGVVYATLNLDWLNNRISQIDLPQETVFFAVDKNGTVLVRLPDQEKWIGKKEEQIADIMRKLQEVGHLDIIEAKDADGTSRFNIITTLGENSKEEDKEESPVYIGLGFSRDFIFLGPDKTFQRNIFGLGFVTLVTLIITWFLGNFFVIRHIKALQEIDKLKSEFVSLVSHQLKTPIAELMGYIENMLGGITGELTIKQRQYFNEMLNICLRAFRLISDLLNLSMIERGMLSMNIAPVKLIEIAEISIKNFSETIKKKSLNISINEKNKNIVVYADKDKSIEALNNIIDNAIKFTDKGAISIEIIEKNNYGIIKVKDTGKGMPEKTLNNLFKTEKVLTGGPTAEKGAGLGLFIAKIFMNKQEGDIDVFSTLGKGSIVILKFKKTNIIKNNTAKI
jgi:signal transduction histidine kinase